MVIRLVEVMVCFIGLLLLMLKVMFIMMCSDLMVWWKVFVSVMLYLWINWCLCFLIMLSSCYLFFDRVRLVL